ncbi:hypothetical protein MMC20_002365 [Loxospora ochrophaea]|nr:hypothetical protein [Loxospora ochrophaea]
MSWNDSPATGWGTETATAGNDWNSAGAAATSQDARNAGAWTSGRGVENDVDMGNTNGDANEGVDSGAGGGDIVELLVILLASVLNHASRVVNASTVVNQVTPRQTVLNHASLRVLAACVTRRAIQLPNAQTSLLRSKPLTSRLGHSAFDCKNNRALDLSQIEDKSPEEAWDMLKAADTERDLDDFRDAVKVYSKAVPDTTYEQLERSFRQNDFSVYLIAYAKDDEKDTYTLVNLQGKIDCKYQVGFFFSAKPRRANARQGWPSGPEENLERLEDAGLPMDRGIPKCTNCNGMGHTSKGCREERTEKERVEVKCVNCEEIGHRARDCPKARVDRFACRNCKQSGHTAAECTEPRSAEGVECKRCNEMGHFAKDCPTGGSQTCRNCGEEGHMSKECEKPKNPATVTCRNCEQMGHFSKDCPEPKDWSKVKCSNCGESLLSYYRIASTSLTLIIVGHTIKRCKQPIPGTEDTANTADGGSNSGVGGFAPTEPAGDWENASAADEAPVSNDGWGAGTDNWNSAPTSGGW